MKNVKIDRKKFRENFIEGNKGKRVDPSKITKYEPKKGE